MRHREGFRAQTAAERAASRTLAAMVLGVAQNPLDLELGIEEETLDQRGHPVLSVLVMFPMSKLVLLPLKYVHQGRIRIFVGTRDQQGRNSPVSQIPVPVQVPNDQLLTALGKTAAFRIRVAVRPGEQTIAVSVRDELGNADATALTHYMAGSKAAKVEAGVWGRRIAAGSRFDENVVIALAIDRNRPSCPACYHAGLEMNRKGAQTMPRVPSSLTTLAAAALLLAPGLAPAQAPAPEGPSEETFFESIDVSVVNVDVVVIDKSGRRITGLSRDDFELREDGKPVEITNFFAVANDVMTAAPEPEPPAPGEVAQPVGCRRSSSST